MLLACFGGKVYFWGPSQLSGAKFTFGGKVHLRKWDSLAGLEVDNCLADWAKRWTRHQVASLKPKERP